VIHSYKQQKGSTNLQAQLKISLSFYCLLRVSGFGKAITRELKIHTQKNNLNKPIQRTFQIAKISTLQRLELFKPKLHKSKNAYLGIKQ
jgi:hypothetical protein